MIHEIHRLDASKKTSGNISIESLKVSAQESASTLMNCFNNSIKEGVFPLRCAKGSPIFEIFVIAQSYASSLPGKNPPLLFLIFSNPIGSKIKMTQYINTTCDKTFFAFNQGVKLKRRKMRFRSFY